MNNKKLVGFIFFIIISVPSIYANYFENSDISEDSRVVNSNIINSTIGLSVITNSNIFNSNIISTFIENTEVRNMKIVGGYLKDGNMCNGTYEYGNLRAVVSSCTPMGTLVNYARINVFEENDGYRTSRVDSNNVLDSIPMEEKKADVENNLKIPINDFKNIKLNDKNYKKIDNNLIYLNIFFGFIFVILLYITLILAIRKRKKMME